MSVELDVNPALKDITDFFHTYVVEAVGPELSADVYKDVAAVVMTVLGYWAKKEALDERSKRTVYRRSAE